MQKHAKPILLFNDECGVCRLIAGWVKRSARDRAGNTTICVRPIGEDPAELTALDPELNIWAAYATIHMLMPDGSMKLGGEAVAEVFRDLPNTKWFAWSFAKSIFGFRPFQMVLNGAYDILAYARPIFGCESCGRPTAWMRPFAWLVEKAKAAFGMDPPPGTVRLSTSIYSSGR